MKCERNFFKDTNNVKKYDIICNNDCLYIIMNLTDDIIELYRLSFVNIACCIYEQDGTYVVCNLKETLNSLLDKRPIPMLIVKNKIELEVEVIVREYDNAYKVIKEYHDYELPEFIVTNIQSSKGIAL